MKLSWGWRIAMLYAGFVILVLTLVIASSRQHFDLVTKNYYDAEIGYQKVLDAGRNQSTLSTPLSIHASSVMVTIEFPEEFRNKELTGDIQFYAPVDAAWDRTFKIKPENNQVIISRSLLRNTRYIIKISCSADGKNYYQESELMLRAS